MFRGAGTVQPRLFMEQDAKAWGGQHFQGLPGVSGRLCKPMDYPVPSVALRGQRRAKPHKEPQKV